MINQTLRLDKIYCKKSVEIYEMSAKSKDGIEAALEWIYENVPKQTKVAQPEDTAEDSSPEVVQ